MSMLLKAPREDSSHFLAISFFKLHKLTYWHLIQRCPGTQTSPMGHQQFSHLHLKKGKKARLTEIF